MTELNNPAIKFLQDAGYTMDSDAEAIDELFLQAMKAFTAEALDPEAIALIAKGFAANTAVDDCLYQDEIRLAAYLAAMLEKDPKTAKVVEDRLRAFYANETKGLKD